MSTALGRRLFGTDGVRGVVNQTFDPFFAVRLALAVGSYFPPGARALVGCDARIGNPAVYNAVLSALAACGIKVYDAGYIPTPALQLAVRDLGFDFGVVVTASHNPPEWVGLKLIASDGIEAPREVEEEIESIFHEQRFRYVPWHEIRSIERYPYAIDYYVEHVKKMVDGEAIRRRRPKIVVDCANSVAALTTPRILKELGAKVLTVNADLGYPFREYEPTPHSIDYLGSIVQSIGADFAVAHDGDGDRAIFVDNRGRFVPGDFSAVILINYVDEKLRNVPKRVVTAVSTSHFLMEWNVVPRGIEIVWTRVGFINIARKIKELGGALAGFEDNGGFAYVPHQLVRDGGMTAALMTELISTKNVDLATLFDEIKKPIVIRTKIGIESREKGFKAVDYVKERYSGYRIIDIDGVKVISDEWAFHVRVSGTEPIIRIMVEGSDKDIVNRVLNEVKTLVEEALSRV